VGGLYYNYEPLTKYSWPDGEQVYIPRATGEVFHTPTRASRFFAISADPQWMYFTPLEKNPLLWSRVVICYPACTMVALLGLFAGISLFLISGPQSDPLHGDEAGAMILRLFVGFLAAPGISAACFRWILSRWKIAGEDRAFPRP